MLKTSFKKAFAEITQTTDEVLKALALTAIHKLRSLLQSKDEKMVLEACKLALVQHANCIQVEVSKVQEVIYGARFGEDGAIISSKEEVEASTTPRNTLELLQGGESRLAP